METGDISAPSRSRNKLFIFFTVILGVVVIGVVVFLLLPEPDPQEVARRWAADNVDAAGEEIAEFILEALGQEGLQGQVLKELGGEWIEDRIHEHLVWDFSETIDGSGNNHIVVVTGRVEFQVDQPPVSGSISAFLPFRLVIRGNEVIEDSIVLSDAGFDAKLEGLEVELSPSRAGDEVEKAGEAIEEVADKLKGLLGN